MSEERPAFQIDMRKLPSRPKEITQEATRAADTAGEQHGFISRAPGKPRGRRPSPRTGQVHAKVFPEVSAEIAEEAGRRGVTQGVLIEEAWALYKAQR